MTITINWEGGFYGIAWAYENKRLVISPIFDNKRQAIRLAKVVEKWNDRFTKLTIIENNGKQYALCCFQDPQISKENKNIGIFHKGLSQIGGYERVKPMIEEKPPLLQIAYASDVKDMKTYEQVSRLVSLSKCKIIKEEELKKQEYYYEKLANENQ